MPFVELADVNLYYERAGEGPPLMMVNGSGSDLRRHPNLLDGDLKSSFDVVCWDHRGLGRSVPADAERVPTMAELASDALSLADRLGWETFRLFGVSFGGMVAQEIALAAGSRVRRMVLACTSAGGAGGSSYPLHEVYDLDDAERAERMIDLLDTRCGDDHELRKVFQRFVPAAPPAPGVLVQMETRRHHDTWDRLSAITVPTLVAAGRYDGVAPLANSEALAARLPNALLEVFDGGHLFMVQDSNAMGAIIRFLSA